MDLEKKPDSHDVNNSNERNQERSKSIKVSLAWSEIDKKGGGNYFILYKTGFPC